MHEGVRGKNWNTHERRDHNSDYGRIQRKWTREPNLYDEASLRPAGVVHSDLRDAWPGRVGFEFDTFSSALLTVILEHLAHGTGHHQLTSPQQHTFGAERSHN